METSITNAMEHKVLVPENLSRFVLLRYRRSDRSNSANRGCNLVVNLEMSNLVALGPCLGQRVE